MLCVCMYMCRCACVYVVDVLLGSVSSISSEAEPQVARNYRGFPRQTQSDPSEAPVAIHSPSLE